MKKCYNFSCLFLLIFLTGMNNYTSAQTEPVMYFCERYGSNGEIGVGDRFYTGHLTVVVKSDYELRLNKVAVQFDRWDPYTATFKYYKKFDYNLEPDMKYVYFSKNSKSDMSFDDPGFYRVFLLDHGDRTIASALVEILK